MNKFEGDCNRAIAHMGKKENPQEKLKKSFYQRIDEVLGVMDALTSEARDCSLPRREEIQAEMLEYNELINSYRAICRRKGW